VDELLPNGRWSMVVVYWRLKLRGKKLPEQKGIISAF
jgi:hypothetical protein